MAGSTRQIIYAVLFIFCMESGERIGPIGAFNCQSVFFPIDSTNNHDSLAVDHLFSCLPVELFRALVELPAVEYPLSPVFISALELHATEGTTTGRPRPRLQLWATTTLQPSGFDRP